MLSNWEVGANFLIFHHTGLKHTMYSSWHIVILLVMVQEYNSKHTGDDIYNVIIKYTCFTFLKEEI